jgi:hypothetical protein
MISASRLPLATATALAFALPFNVAAATRILVTDCTDSGTGSLRAAVASASSGAQIDLTKLTCSTITLKRGAIEITQDSLSFAGKSQTIDGDGKDRVFAHTGTGTLTFSSLKIVGGKFESPTEPDGGCIDSAGSVVLSNVTVSDCQLNSAGTAYSRGAGVFATGALTLTHSTISGNVATADTSSALGAGAYVAGDLLASYSTIENNSALPSAGISSRSRGGGLHTRGTVKIGNSTIAENYAQVAAGAYFAYKAARSGTIQNSTISGNTASLSAGGFYSVLPLIVQNTTVAFNRATTIAGGIGVGKPMSIEDSIVSGNTLDDVEVDIDGRFITSVDGSHDVIPVSDMTLPADTIHACPKLGPLALNGGPTRTHDLSAGSPAIGAGATPINATNDQRGSGFPRIVGAPDIGAVEMQGEPSSRVFANAFETVCDR